MLKEEFESIINSEQLKDFKLHLLTRCGNKICIQDPRTCDSVIHFTCQSGYVAISFSPKNDRNATKTKMFIPYSEITQVEATYRKP